MYSKNVLKIEFIWSGKVQSISDMNLQYSTVFDLNVYLEQL